MTGTKPWRRGRWIETPPRLAEQIGVPMNEDVGTLADINAAGAGWGRPPFLSLWGKFGSDYARAGSAMISSSRSSRGRALAAALAAGRAGRAGELLDAARSTAAATVST